MEAHSHSLAGFCMVPVWSNPLFLWVEVDVDDDQDDAPEDVDDDDHVGDHVEN